MVSLSEDAIKDTERGICEVYLGQSKWFVLTVIEVS